MNSAFQALRFTGSMEEYSKAYRRERPAENRAELTKARERYAKDPSRDNFVLLQAAEGRVRRDEDYREREYDRQFTRSRD
jgi:hypothetical protein